MYRYDLVTPNTDPIVTLQEVKSHCDIDADNTDRDTDIQAYIDAVRDFWEKQTDRSMLATTWRLYLDEFPYEIELCRCPVQSVTSVKYYSSAGVLTTLDPSDYQVSLTEP
ncbi:MAG: hypothetical protein FD130_2297, partial [Halothiobacillaceae bacterium]